MARRQGRNLKAKGAKGQRKLEERPTRFVVKGQIRQADGTPLAGGLVRAFDKDLRSEQPLGREVRGEDWGQVLNRAWKASKGRVRS